MKKIIILGLILVLIALPTVNAMTVISKDEMQLRISQTTSFVDFIKEYFGFMTTGSQYHPWLCEHTTGIIYCDGTESYCLAFCCNKGDYDACDDSESCTSNSDCDTDEICWGSPKKCVELDCPSGTIPENHECVSTSTCTDSDGGKNYNEKGVVTVTSNSGEVKKYDYCSSGTTLKERYCSSGEAKTTSHTCPGSCSDGKCISSGGSGTCTDSDGGLDYSMKGTCVDDAGSNTDYCDGDTLKEMYCDSHPYTGDNVCYVSSYSCPGGCQDGRCITSSSPEVTILYPENGKDFQTSASKLDKVILKVNVKDTDGDKMTVEFLIKKDNVGYLASTKTGVSNGEVTATIINIPPARYDWEVNVDDGETTTTKSSYFTVSTNMGGEQNGTSGDETDSDGDGIPDDIDDFPFDGDNDGIPDDQDVYDNTWNYSIGDENTEIGNSSASGTFWVVKSSGGTKECIEVSKAEYPTGYVSKEACLSAIKEDTEYVSPIDIKDIPIWVWGVLGVIVLLIIIRR